MQRLIAFILRVLLLAMVLAAPARADLTVDIVGGGSNRYPLTILPLQNEEWLPEAVTQTVKSDLAMTGLFGLLEAPAGVALPASPQAFDTAPWLQNGSRAVLYGKVSKLDNGMLRLTFWADTVNPREQKLAAEFDVHSSQLRDVAHRIADMTYEALLGG